MRNLSILAFIGFSIIFSGCGTIRTAAIAIHHDTCIAHYNMFVCATPAPPAAIESDKPCVGTAVRSSTSATIRTSGSVGTKGCKLLHQQLQIKSLKSRPGTKCSIENNQEVVCADLWPLFAPMVIGWLLQGLTPSLRRRVVLAAVIAAITLIAIHEEVEAGITCQKAVTVISAKEKVAPAVAIVLLEGCKLSEAGSVKDLWNRSDRLERAAKNIVASAERYCEGVRGIGAVECFQQINTLAEVTEGKSLEASNLWLAAKEKADAERRAKAKAQQKAEIKALLEAGDKQIEEAKELIEAMQGLKLEEGSCGGFLIVLLYGFLGFLDGCRSKLLVVLVALGCIVSTADATCTDAQISGDKVAAQYGLVFYNCDDEVVSQASKDAVFEVIWRGFVAKDGLKLGMSKSYVRSRWERAEGAFWAVWKDMPLWQAQVAAAICVRETNCGVTVKFSEWETRRFESPRNGNGSIDCGITQINSRYTEFTCDELQDLDLAFKEQRRILMEKIKSEKKSVWKKRVFRYNGSGKSAREYGEKIWDWSGASFGWVALLMGLFGRRKDTYMVPVKIKKDAIIEIGRDQFVLDCHLIIFTIHDPNQKVVGHRFCATDLDGIKYIKDGYKGYFRKEGDSL